MYSSTGPHLYIVYKTGQLVLQYTDIFFGDYSRGLSEQNTGFMAEVSFVTSGYRPTNWSDMKFCKPLRHMSNNLGTQMEITYDTTTPDLPVQCTYTAHIQDQEILIVGSTADNIQIALTDFPSATAGKKLSPFRIYNWTTINWEDATTYYYNLSSAVYGFHLSLEPSFSVTDPRQRFIVISSKSPVLAESSMIYAIDWPNELDKLAGWLEYCPYTVPHPVCDPPCCNITDTQLDDSCVLYELGANHSYTRCASVNHCYNIHIDRCDGFIDCGSDEVECFPKDLTPMNQPGNLWLLFCLVLIIPITIIVVIVIVCLHRRRARVAALPGNV